MNARALSRRVAARRRHRRRCRLRFGYVGVAQIRVREMSCSVRIEDPFRAGDFNESETGNSVPVTWFREWTTLRSF